MSSEDTVQDRDRPVENVKITPQMIEAGINAWGTESSFHGPPDVEGKDVVCAIYRAMFKASLSTSEYKR